MLQLAAAPLHAVAIFYLLDLSRATLIAPWIGWLALAGFWPTYRAWRSSSPGRPAPDRTVWVAWLMTALLAGLLLFQFRDSFIPAAHDHLTPLAVGRAIAHRGTALHEAYAVNASLAAYPPGLGVLTAPLFFFLGDVTTIGLYTWIGAATVALIPLVWGAALRRMVLPSLPLGPVVAAMAIGFFLMDRTLLNASVYAGKSGFLTAALLVPVATLLLVEGVGDLRREALAVLAALGAVTIHYSAAYMLACILSAWLLVERPPLRIWIRLAVAGAVILVLFAPLAFAMAKNSMTLATQGQVGPLGEYFLGFLAERRNTMLFLYNIDDKLRVAPWPWKGLALLGCFAFAAATAKLTKQDRRITDDLGAVARFATIFFVAVGFAILLASGLVPKGGIDRLYTTWYLFFLMAPVFASLPLALWVIARSSDRRPVALIASSIGLIAVLAVGGRAFADDYLRTRVYILRAAIPRADVAALRDVLRRAETDGPCYVISTSGALSSDIMPNIVQVTHAHRPLDYMALMSGCVSLTGTFVTNAVPGGRDAGGYPSIAMLAALPKNAVVLFIGTEGELERYRKFSAKVRTNGVGMGVGPHIATRLRHTWD